MLCGRRGDQERVGDFVNCPFVLLQGTFFFMAVQCAMRLQIVALNIIQPLRKSDLSSPTVQSPSRLAELGAEMKEPRPLAPISLSAD